MKIMLSFSQSAQNKGLILIACLMLCSLNINAFSRTFYYRVTVASSPSGKGSVYIDSEAHSTNDDGIATDVSYVNSTTKTYEKSVGRLNSSARQNVYVYAKPGTGYVFNNWTVTGNGEITTPESNNTLVALTSTSTSSSSPATFTITANFVNDVGMVKCRTSNANRGAVSISKTDNVEGDEVTLTATPLMKLKGVKFLYWEKVIESPQSVERIESQEVITVTATNEKTTYIAYFSEPTQEKGIYCRIKNRSTGNYLSVYGNTPGTYSTEGSGNNQRPVYTFNSLKMVTPAKAISDPSTILLISGGDNNAQGLLNTDLEGQGVKFSTDLAVHSDSNAKWTEINTNSTASGYRFVMNYTSSQGNTFPLFLRDQGNSGVRFGSNNDEASFWDIEPIDEGSIDKFYFGVAPSLYFTKEDDQGNTKYYTTLYTDFSYKLMDGVAAYYVENESSIEGSIVHLTKIPTGNIVPARMGVILECSSYGDASQNRLVPVASSTDSEVRLINGTFALNGERPDPDDFPDVVVYVLSVNSNYENMGFYRYHQPLAPNKAYVAVPVSDQSRAQNAQLVWGNHQETTSVDHIELALPDNQKIYDLQGREVNNPSHGIYIRGGKKYIVK